MSSFPGSTSLSFLDVYSDNSADGQPGGTPHVHLVSTEAYVVIGGRGAVQTLTPEGFNEHDLSPGSVVWFTPGTIHRAINHDALQVVVLMSNAGLPEAGDAVMTFSADIVADPIAYRLAASLEPGDAQAGGVRDSVSSGAADQGQRAERAAVRRDLAVRGFSVLRDALRAGDTAPLREFYRSAAALVRPHTDTFAAIVRDGPLTQAEASLGAIDALARGDNSHLTDAFSRAADPAAGARKFGMCGRLHTYSMADPETTGASANPE